MTKSLHSPIEVQQDTQTCQLLQKTNTACYYKVEQVTAQGTRTQRVKVQKDIHNHFVLQREKDLLHYLNQFKEFIPFNEIRKTDFNYLQYFDYKGKNTLYQSVKKKGKLSTSKAKILLKSMVASLKHLHQAGFVHTQVSPEHILKGKNQFYLIDLEQAIPQGHHYETELMPTNVYYCPPERMNGKYGTAGDIYALGCTLYFVLTGKHIYQLNKVKDKFDQLYAHAFHTPRKLNKLPIFWRQLIIWMTQKSPENRPGLADLERWQSEMLVPKKIRKQSIQGNKSFPEDSLTELADYHYLYARFIKSNVLASQDHYESAFNLLEGCVFEGYTRAENNLGLMYEKGLAIKQSYHRASQLFYQAYQKGNPFAAYHLGKMYEQGKSESGNLKQAFILYEFAALRGHLMAQTRLSLLYENGECIPKDEKKARFWQALAAHYGQGLGN